MTGTAVGTVGNRCEVHVLVKGLVDPVKEINRFVTLMTRGMIILLLKRSKLSLDLFSSLILESQSTFICDSQIDCCESSLFRMLEPVLNHRVVALL